jgi:hypothetical protein
MFAEMLTHSEEKIFLEAIDQYFENEPFEDINLINREIQEEKIYKPGINGKDINLVKDQEKETDIEIMNIKFYEALNIGGNNIKDISTDFESEDYSLNAEKSSIKISDCLILTKDRIEENNQKIFKEYKNQIILEEKIKELFKQDEIKAKDKRNYLNLDNLNNDNGIKNGNNNDKCVH